MDSKTFALLMFKQGKNTKEASLVISELYLEDAFTERMLVGHFQRKRPVQGC